MTNPKHPAKIVIVLRGGLVDAVFTDKKEGVRVFIADYDHPMDGLPGPSEDAHGQMRCLYEDTAMLDTAAVRNIINKKGGKNV